MTVYNGNLELGKLIGLSAASAGVTSAPQTNQQSAGIKVVIDITAISGTGATLTVTLRGRDPVSGKTYTLLASAGLTAVGTTVLSVFPGAVASANAVANDHVPLNFDVTCTIAGTTPSVTATIGGTLLCT